MRARHVLAQLAALAGAIVVAGLLASAVAALVMHVPEPTTVTIGLFLAISGALTLALGAPLLWLVAGQPRLGLRARLTIALAAGSAVSLLNVLVTAWLMFISAHDLGLLLLLLLFSLLVSLSFAAVLSRAVMSRLDEVTAAARRMAAGDLSARVDEAGRGELAELGRSFNRMAERVERAFARERELDAARRALVAGVSHDLRSPLASIRAAVEALHDGVVADPGTVRRYQAGLVQDVARLSRLIDDLFELARLDAGAVTLHPERTALGDLVSDTLEGFRPRAQARGIALDGAVEGEPAAYVDAARIQRVLDNLLENALRHTPAGGHIAITARERPDGAQLEVRDSGPGIAAGDLARVFERFYRGDPARGRDGGAGLGLAIVRGLVEAHGGTVAVESGPGQGARFIATLPARPPAAAEAWPEPDASAAAGPTRPDIVHP